MTSSALVWPVRVAGLVVAIVLAWLIIALAVTDWLASANPRLAPTLWPGQSAAPLRIAERALADGDLAAVETNARTALRSDPSSARALVLLGRAAAEEGDRGQADTLMAMAADRSLRDLVAQAWAFDRDVRSGDIEKAADGLDTIFRGQSDQDWPKVAPFLLGFVTSAAAGPEVARVLATDPPWRTWLLGEVSRQAADVDGLFRLFTLLQVGPSPPTQEELRPFLDRLIKEGRIDQAYYAWLQSLSEEQLAALEPLYNAKFQYGLSNLPFDWTIIPVRGALSRISGERGHRVLSVDFFGGRVVFRNIAHLLMLPPGSYVLSGREMAENLVNDRGIRWRVACFSDPNGAIGETQLLRGTVAWRDFSAAFTVPNQGCPVQNLVLELPSRIALDLEIRGSVAYTDLGIERR